MIDKVGVIVCMRGKPNPSYVRVWYQTVETHVTSMGTPPHYPDSPHIYRGAKVHHATTHYWYLYSSCWNGRKSLHVPGSAVQTCILFMKVVLARYTLLHTTTRTPESINIAMGIPETVRLYNPSIDKYIPLSYSTLFIEIIQLCGTARNDTEQTENIK